ncbi:MAG: discoidin domain-containing protein, partial [Chloroflexi bacterium]|nr:discoidin domain-containing protein [Chloroflexota bacterium]
PDITNHKHSPSTATGYHQPLLILGVQQFDLSPYDKIPLTESQLQVSSFSDPWYKDYLVKSGTEGFWHIQRPRQEERAWVLVDLGTEQAVPLLRVKPRTDFAEQMWFGYTAELEASNDKQNWTPLAVLGVHQTNLTDDWLYFLVGNLQPYRYYRLSVWDIYFFSMARMELYRFR